MFEEMSSFLIGFDLTSVCFGFLLCIFVTCVGESIVMIFDFIKWIIKFISNRNSPRGGEDK